MKCWPVPIANASESAATRNTLGTTRAGALAHLARLVEARLPEDEHEQQDQEREPARLVIPEQTPEDRLRVDDQRRAARARRRGRSRGRRCRSRRARDARERAAPNVFSGVGERMYGRLERTSATGSPFSGSAATRRSYLPHDRDHRVGPVVERMIVDDAPAQLGADRVARRPVKRRQPPRAQPRARRDRAAARRAAAASRRGTARAPRWS